MMEHPTKLWLTHLGGLVGPLAPPGLFVGVPSKTARALVGWFVVLPGAASPRLLDEEAF